MVEDKVPAEAPRKGMAQAEVKATAVTAARVDASNPTSGS